MAEIGDGCGGPAGFGGAGDQHIWVVGAQLLAVGDAALQDRPAGRVQRHRVRACPQPDGPRGGVELVESQQADLAAGGGVQQRQNPEQGLVGVDSGIAGPAVKITKDRGQLRSLADGREFMVTVHPSFLLRIPPEDREKEMARFVADLKVVAVHIKSF